MHVTASTPGHVEGTPHLVVALCRTLTNLECSTFQTLDLRTETYRTQTVWVAQSMSCTYAC